MYPNYVLASAKLSHIFKGGAGHGFFFWWGEGVVGECRRPYDPGN